MKNNLQLKRNFTRFAGCRTSSLTLTVMGTAHRRLFQRGMLRI